MREGRDSQVLGCCLILGLVLITAVVTVAQVPRKINYQGRITDSDTGEPLPGNHDITFRVYDSVIDGDMLWSEQQTASADSAGVLSAVLGSSTPIDIVFESPCWLEVELDGEVLLPRREIVSVPYAFHALNSDSLAGLGRASFSLAGHSHDEAYVNEGEDSSVTAAMVLPDVVSSIDGVTNDGGDIDLVAGSNITITPDDASDRITIEATGGASGDITAVYADDGLSGGATTGDAHLSVNTGTGLEVSGDAVGLTSDYSTGSAHDSRFINEAQASSVTAAMTVPDIVSSVDGVTNDGGNIDLVAGSKITITPDDGSNKITIAATGVADGHSLDAADGSPTDVVYVDNVGRVGIETTDPDFPLHVRSTLMIGPPGYEGPMAVRFVIMAEGNTSSEYPLVIKNPDGVLLRMQADGKLGLGHYWPLTMLHIEESDLDLESDALQFEDVVVEDLDAVVGLYSGDAGNAGSAVSFAEISAGNLADKWAIIRETTRGGSGGGSGLRFTFGTGSDHFTNPIVMYLDDTGKVGIGTKSFGADLFKVNGSACATAWNSCSDLKFKENIENVENALAKVLKLRGVRFNWRRQEYEDRGFPEGAHYGVIAQEAEVVLPEIVSAAPDGERSIAYAEIVPILIESIKELRAENLALIERIEALEGARN